MGLREVSIKTDSGGKLTVVYCSNCGQGDPFLAGALSEEQVRGYICLSCRVAVLEVRVDKKKRKTKNVLLG